MPAMRHDGSDSNVRGPGRPREFDVNAVLDGVIAVFSEKGFGSTSIGDLTARTGLTAGSLYKAFPNKRGILVAALDRYLALRAETLQARLAGAQTGRDRIRAVLEVYADYSHDAMGRQGCLVVSSAIDLSNTDVEVGNRVTRVFEQYETRLVEFIGAGRQDGSIPSHVDEVMTARLLLCVTQGMRVLGKTGRTYDEMLRLVDATMKLLD